MNLSNQRAGHFLAGEVAGMLLSSTHEELARW